MICIAGREISRDAPPFVMAELSGNHNQSLERALEIVNAAGIVKEGEPGALFEGRLENAFRGAVTLTFGGGVNEVQRDIIAMAGLRLPRARR